MATPTQYSCLENSMGIGTWWATIHEGPKELDMTEHALIYLLFIFIGDFRQSRAEIFLPTLYSSIKTLQNMMELHEFVFI